MEWKTLQELLATGEYEELRAEDYSELDKIVSIFLSKENWTIKELREVGLNFEVDTWPYREYKCRLIPKGNSHLKICLSRFKKVEGEYVDPFTKKKGHNWHYEFHTKDIVKIDYNGVYNICCRFDTLVNEYKYAINNLKNLLEEKRLLCNGKELYKANGNNKEIEVKALWEEIGDFNLEWDNVITLHKKGLIDRSTAQSLLNRIKKGYSGIVSVGLFEGEREKSIKRHCKTSKSNCEN